MIKKFETFLKSTVLNYIIFFFFFILILIFVNNGIILNNNININKYNILIIIIVLLLNIKLIGLIILNYNQKLINYTKTHILTKLIILSVFVIPILQSELSIPIQLIISIIIFILLFSLDYRLTLIINLNCIIFTTFYLVSGDSTNAEKFASISFYILIISILHNIFENHLLNNFTKNEQ